MTTRLDRACAIALSLYFLVGGPLRLMAGESFAIRLLVIYAVVAPLVGLLLLVRHPRARFATYVFLSMDLVRAIATASWAFLAADLAILLLLQTPLMRRIYPRIDPAAVRARWRRRRGAGQST